MRHVVSVFVAVVVAGIAYAAGSIAEARSHAADLIAAGRVHIVQASVAALPIGGAQFDLVTAVETHYYWPGLVRCFGEVRRVLRPGGQFVLIAEVHGTPASGWLLRLAMAPMRASALSVEEHRKLLEEAGYEGIELTTDRRAWLCAVAETGHHRTGLLLEVTKVRSIKDWKW